MGIELLIEGEGLREVDVIEVDPGSRRLEVIAEFAKRRGIAKEELLLFVEDGDEPLDLAVLVEDDEQSRRVHHVHRHRVLEVKVFYQGREMTRSFSPGSRIQRVLDWAVSDQAFKIDPAIAPEMELSLHGETTALPKSAHIGRYAHHPSREVSLDLIRGIVPNG